MRFAFVEAQKQKHSIELLCRVMQVSQRGFYAWRRRPKSKHQERDEGLAEQIKMFHCGSRMTYGSPRIYRDLKAAGQRVGKKRVARLMKQHQLRGKCKRRFKVTTQQNPKRQVANNLLVQNFQADSPNQKWVSDITYIVTKDGWLYLAVVLDLYSRRVIGWSMSERITNDLTLKALRMAIQCRRTHSKADFRGLIFHSDKGSQYASTAFKLELEKHHIAQSMSGKGNCFDNAVSESFFATLKTEGVKSIGKCGYNTRQVAQTAIFAYIEGFYNRTGRHSTLGFLSPLDFENQNHHYARQVA
ncbi:MAG: IS3 family transposase [Thermaceae bacterium]|nr:IS3 family transposase [Thermaceae bacterium]